MDLKGHYVLPGLVDMHGHIGGEHHGARVKRNAATRMRSPRRASFRMCSSVRTSRSRVPRKRDAGCAT
jgi:imidazolonepropionase-like amidohydrolase